MIPNLIIRQRLEYPCLAPHSLSIFRFRSMDGTPVHAACRRVARLPPSLLQLGSCTNLPSSWVCRSDRRTPFQVLEVVEPSNRHLPIEARATHRLSRQ